MMFQQKLSATTLSFLLLIAFLKLPLLQSRHTPVTCIPECGAGYECVTGLCQRQQCSTDCSGEERQVMCGSNGVTYNNLCELEKARCELRQDISVQKKGPCISSAAQQPTCVEHQRECDVRTWEKYTTKCNLVAGFAKYYNGTLDYSDVVNCYRPQCNADNTDHYLLKQCSLLFSGYCWCSSREGHLIPNTFQRNMPEGYCSNDTNKLKCEVDGRTYDDGEIFTPPSVCGRCECASGTHTCFINFTVNDSDQLSSDQLDNLKQLTLQVFLAQYDNNSNIQEVLRAPAEADVSTSKKEAVLRWKFSDYNKNGDSVLNPTEEFSFRSDLWDFFGCSKFFNQLSDLLDGNSDNVISLQEWYAFFGLNTQGTPNTNVSAEGQNLITHSVPVKSKRAVPIAVRKPLSSRKKFRYALPKDLS